MTTQPKRHLHYGIHGIERIDEWPLPTRWPAKPSPAAAEAPAVLEETTATGTTVPAHVPTAEHGKPTRRRRTARWAAITVLVLLCILLACGFAVFAALHAAGRWW